MNNNIDIGEFKRLYRAGWTYSQLAEYFHKTTSTMQSLKGQLKLTKPVVCPNCKRTHEVGRDNRQLCNKCKKIRREQYFLIRSFRRDFNMLLRHFPQQAFKWYNEICSEEGVDFARMLIGRDLLDALNRELKIMEVSV